MARLGAQPELAELEERLFCDDCRGGSHGQVVSYDHQETQRLLDANELRLDGRCVRCGQEYEAKPRRHRPHAEEQREGAEFKAGAREPDAEKEPEPEERKRGDEEKPHRRHA